MRKIIFVLALHSLLLANALAMTENAEKSSQEKKALELVEIYQQFPRLTLDQFEQYLRQTIALPPDLRAIVRDAEADMHLKQRRQPKSRIAIVSNYDDGYFDIGVWSDLNKFMYAKKHGYDLYLYHKKFDSRSCAWSKVAAINEVLDSYDWVFWSDADALFMNHAIKLETFLDDQYDIIIGDEAIKYHDQRVMNTGNFFIKRSDHSKYILDIMWADKYPNTEPHWWDQGALLALLRYEPEVKKWIKLMPMRMFNSSPWQHNLYEYGDFIIHFYGCENPYRTWQMEKMYKNWNLAQKNPLLISPTTEIRDYDRAFAAKPKTSN